MRFKVFAVTAMLAAAVGSQAGQTAEAGTRGVEDATRVSGNGVEGGGAKRTLAQRPDHLDLGEPSISELSRWLAAMSRITSARKCSEWTERDLIGGFLVPVRGAARLLVGMPDDEAGPGTTRIRDVERNYLVTSFTRSGAPLEGAIKIKMPRDEMQGERVCLEQLHGVAVAWPILTDDPSDVEETVEMVVREVSFAAAGEIGPSGAARATGETIATLAVSERWASMAYRQLWAHRWGVLGGMVGSIVLMTAMWMCGWAVRRVRTYARWAGVGREASAEDAERRVEGRVGDDGRTGESQEGQGKGAMRRERGGRPARIAKSR